MENYVQDKDSWANWVIISCVHWEWELNRPIIHSTFMEHLLCVSLSAGHWHYGCGNRHPSQMDFPGKPSRILALDLLGPRAPSTLGQSLSFSILQLYFPLFEVTLCQILSTPALHQPSFQQAIPKKEPSHSSSSNKASKLGLIGPSWVYSQTNHSGMEKKCPD